LPAGSVTAIVVPPEANACDADTDAICDAEEPAGVAFKITDPVGTLPLTELSAIVTLNAVFGGGFVVGPVSASEVFDLTTATGIVVTVEVLVLLLESPL